MLVTCILRRIWLFWFILCLQEGKERVEVTALHTEHVSCSGDVGRPPQVITSCRSDTKSVLYLYFFWRVLIALTTCTLDVSLFHSHRSLQRNIHGCLLDHFQRSGGTHVRISPIMLWGRSLTVWSQWVSPLAWLLTKDQLIYQFMVFKKQC